MQPATDSMLQSEESYLFKVSRKSSFSFTRDLLDLHELVVLLLADRLEGKTRERSTVNIEAGQKGSGDVSTTVLDVVVDQLGQALDLVLTQLDGCGGVVIGVVGSGRSYTGPTEP